MTAIKPHQKTHLLNLEKKQSPEFDQFEQYIDEKSMCTHFTDHFKDLGGIIGCDILKVLYVPLRKFQVLYQLKCQEKDVKDPILLVRFFQKERSKKRYRKAALAAINKKSVLHLEALDAVAWIFPEDPKFPMLRAIFNGKRPLSSQRKKQGSSSFDPDDVDLKILSYHPGNRCALKSKNMASNEYFVCKIQDSRLTAEADRHLLDLWQSAKRRFKMPRPLGCNRALGIRWESFEEGKTLEESYLTLSFRPLISALTVGLSNLHKIPIGDLNPIGSQAQIISQIGKKTLPRLLAALPFHRQKINVLHKNLVQQARSFPVPSMGTLHGDLHTANILIGTEDLILIDMDSLAIGDPEYDLAYFGSRLLLNALSRKKRVTEVANAVADLTETYKASGGFAVSHQTFSWYLSAFLLSREIKSCVLHRVPELERLTGNLLDIAAKVLKEGRFDASIVVQ